MALGRHARGGRPAELKAELNAGGTVGAEAPVERDAETGTDPAAIGTNDQQSGKKRNTEPPEQVRPPAQKHDIALNRTHRRLIITR
jgi:hypothetical protein